MNRRVNNRAKPVTAMLQMQAVHRDETQVVDLKKTSYLPYLFNLVMPKMFYQSPNRIVVARLYLDVHKHDKQAAEYFEGFQTPCFEVPASLFPGAAPLDKIVFLPTVMLPMGFEAGGVFGPGVLPRRSYPIDLMSSVPKDHKGPTPPLFIGLRSLYVKLPSEVESFLDNVGEFPASQDAVVYGMHPYNTLFPKEHPLELMLRPDFTLSMVYNIPAPPSPPSPYPYHHDPVQYNIYTPDLSNVLMLMPHQRNLTVAMLSTVNHPHVPSVALATMGDEEFPKFQLPSDVFPICEGVNRPIFLPKRFLPRGFEAGCVFKPGSLSELWFVNYIGRFGTPQPQHTSSITPPLFVGKYSRGKAGAVNMLKEIQLECERNVCQGAESLEEASLEAVEPKTPYFLVTQGFVVMETEQPTPPRGAYCLESYEEATEKGCIVKVIETTDTQEEDELDPIQVESEVEDRGEDEDEDEDKKKYLSCFNVDSDIDLISEAMADMGTAEMSLVAKEEALPGVDGARALDQLRQVLEDRSEIRSHTDQLMQDHIYRMDRNRMLALRQPIRMCSGCGMLH
ncbi:DM7 family protein GG17593 [Drosophila teissieri]|uniref:DM7 family protein GG17593 n=1 Tax=Drosophila teissieri TaxID=7243 RepID=UPI001CB9F970|nr:DM7 family protein GG17593 [Drosophila teissieri]